MAKVKLTLLFQNQSFNYHLQESFLAMCWRYYSFHELFLVVLGSQVSICSAGLIITHHRADCELAEVIVIVWSCNVLAVHCDDAQLQNIFF